MAVAFWEELGESEFAAYDRTGGKPSPRRKKSQA